MNRIGDSREITDQICERSASALLAERGAPFGFRFVVLLGLGATLKLFNSPIATVWYRSRPIFNVSVVETGWLSRHWWSSKALG